MNALIESKDAELVKNKPKAEYSSRLYSPYFRAARGIYLGWVREGTGRKKFAIRTYERLKGVECAFMHFLRESAGAELGKLNEEYISLRTWIIEVVTRSELSGYYITEFDRRALNSAQTAPASKVTLVGIEHE